MGGMKPHRLEAVAERLGVSRSDDGPLTVEHDGLALVISDEGDKSKKPSSSMRLGLAAPLSPVVDGGGTGYRRAQVPTVDGRPELLLRREEDEDHRGKMLGLNREIQTGDASFDSAVYVELHSDAKGEVVQEALGSPETRAAAVALLELGCKHLKINFAGKNEVEVLLPIDLDEPDTLERALSLVAELARSLPRFAGESTHRRRNFSIALVILATVGWLAGIITAVVAYDVWWTFDAAPVLIAILVGLGALLPWAGIAWLLSRGHSDGLLTFMVLTIAGVTGLPATAMAGFHIANGAFDPHPPQTHSVPILSKGRCGNDQYCVEVRDFRPERARPLEVVVTSEIYDKAETGKTLTLVVGPGRFGWPWAVDKRLE